MPVLEVLRGAGLKNVCCVVTRYLAERFGPGDLFVYTAATQEALAAADEASAVQEMPEGGCRSHNLHEHLNAWSLYTGGSVTAELWSDGHRL